jgi:hypothetical protein
MQPNCKPKRKKWMDKSKIHLKESESNLPTDINENDLYDDNVLDD